MYQAAKKTKIQNFIYYKTLLVLYLQSPLGGSIVPAASMAD